jgi:hypothetical protein
MSHDVGPELAGMMLLAIGRDTPDVIVKIGQQGIKQGRLVQLARDMGEENKKALLAIGATFPEDKEKDRLLIPVLLPVGWDVRATNHYMWSDLIDPSGNKRGSVGYKGAFWDRWATFYFVRRYILRHEYSTSVDEKEMPKCIRKLQKVVTETRWRQPNEQEKRAQEMAYYRKLGGRGRVYHYDDFGSKYSSYSMYGGPDYEGERDNRGRIVPATKFEPEWIEYTEEVKKDLFDPHNNMAHRRLPYGRFVVEDTVTGARMWTSKWLTVGQWIKLEHGDRKDREKNHPGLQWLREHLPEWNDVLAYWT